MEQQPIIYRESSYQSIAILVCIHSSTSVRQLNLYQDDVFARPATRGNQMHDGVRTVYRSCIHMGLNLCNGYFARQLAASE